MLPHLVCLLEITDALAVHSGAGKLAEATLEKVAASRALVKSPALKKAFARGITIMKLKWPLKAVKIMESVKQNNMPLNNNTITNLL